MNSSFKPPFSPPRRKIPDQIVALIEISRVVDEHPELRDLVQVDLARTGEHSSERMSAEQLLRVLIIGHWGGYGDTDLAFHVVNSMVHQRFCLFGAVPPSYETIQRNTPLVQEETWNQIHETLLKNAGRSWKKKYRGRPL